jgi:hypothetical protein
MCSQHYSQEMRESHRASQIVALACPMAAGQGVKNHSEPVEAQNGETSSSPQHELGSE